MKESPWQKRELVALLTLFFLVSGSTALIYEVIWMRMLTLVFGATQLATATVLAAFMAGLALGATLGGRWMDRSRNLLITYAVLEAVIGLYALAFPSIMGLGEMVYHAFHRSTDPSFAVQNSFNGALMILLLLLPTSCMGATLPALARFATEAVDDVGTTVGRLYAVNTTGAVLGVWSAGFILLPWFGMQMTIYIAAGANLLLAAAALMFGLRSDSRIVAPRAVPASYPRSPSFWPVALAFGLSGLCAMVYEVAWNRFLALILGSSVYSFTLMLMAFLIGIAGGAWAGTRLIRSRKIDPHLAAIVCLAGAAISAYTVHHAFGQMPYWFVEMYAFMRYNDTLLWVMHLILACLVMTGSTVFMGAMFPIAVAAAVRDPDKLATDVGRLYTINTSGGILGSILAGFVLIPTLGIQWTLLAAVTAGLLGALALLITWRASAVRRLVGVAIVLVALTVSLTLRPSWDPLLLSAGMYKYVSDLEEFSREGVRNYAVSDYELLYYKEGVTTTVTVARALGDGNIWLANNGKIDASTKEDLATQVLLGHFGFLFIEEPRRALMVGLASGISAGSAALYDEAHHDILEIEPSIVEASHYFDFINNRPLEHDYVDMLVNDARNHLYLTEEPYDIIVNQPSNPWISGVANLYTREYFELCKQHMTDDGVLVQWMQLYGMGREDLRCILRTLHDVFPNVILLSSIEEADIVMVASAAPLSFDMERIQRILDRPGPGDDLNRVGIYTVEDMLTYYLMDDVDIEKLVGEGILNTDDNMTIEFSAPRYLHFATAADNFQLLLDGTSGPWRKLEPLYDDDIEKAAFYDRMGQAYFGRRQVDRALLVYLRAVKLDPQNMRYRETALLVQEALQDGHWSDD